MNFGKQLLLHAYYHATLRERRLAEWRRCARGAEPVRILFYHRVADVHPNPWTLSCKQFSKQIDWLSSHYDVISLAKVQELIDGGSIDRPAVAITFDDGYAENCDFALPLLQDRGLPFTYFVTTGNMREQTPFPHDIQRGMPLQPNTPDQIAALADLGVEIGAHTRTHADLGDVNVEQLAWEIAGSKDDLEKLIGGAVRYFAFPFGQHANMTTTGFQVVHEAGFAGVCSAYGGYNFPGKDSFHLERFHADPEIIRLKNWLSIDPRKLRTIESFDPNLRAEIKTSDWTNAPPMSAASLIAEGSRQ